MADAGIGEAMLISAAIGAGTGAAGSAISGGDPMKGALTGALMGGVTGGAGAAFGSLGSTAGTAAGTLSENAANTAIANQAVLDVAPSIAPEVSNAALQSNLANSGTLQSGLDLGTNYGAVSGQVPGAQTVGINTLPSNTPTYQYGGPQGNLISSANTANLPIAQTLEAPVNAPPQASTSKGMFDFGYKGPTPNALGYGPQSNMALAGIGATSGLSAAMQTERDKYRVPETEHYTGPLSRFKYDPSTYNPDVVRPPTPPYRAVYAAEGGIMSLAPNGYAMGGPAPTTNFANPSQSMMGTSQYSMATDPMSGNIANRMAAGGITSLGSYSDGGRLLKGPGDGMSDNIPARIGQKQEARLADGEFVIPADVVSHLGNGSTDAGAKTLYSMMSKVRKARTGTKKQGRQIEASSYLPA